MDILKKKLDEGQIFGGISMPNYVTLRFPFQISGAKDSSNHRVRITIDGILIAIVAGGSATIDQD
jgi:hypothetical protein